MKNRYLYFKIDRTIGGYGSWKNLQIFPKKMNLNLILTPTHFFFFFCFTQFSNLIIYRNLSESHFYNDTLFLKKIHYHPTGC